MPVDFLTDEQLASYGRFSAPPSQAELERFFFLDDADRGLAGKRRGEANVLGFGVQVGTVRCLGTFLPDPADVPTVAIDYVTGQLGIADPSCLKAYAARAKTRLEHQWEIARAYGYRDFALAEAELSGWIADRAWTTGDGPRPLFVGAVAWLRERRVLLPGVSVLARCVATVREATTQRLWDTLAARPSPAQARRLDHLLDVHDGRLSKLERLRDGPTATSGKGLVVALERVGEVAGLGFAGVAVDDVPRRRLVELARWGMAAKASALRRHPYKRRLATLLATCVYLEAKAVDDALELFDVLMANELLGRAVRESNKVNLRRYPRVARDAAACAAAVGVLLESEADVGLTVEALWQAIDAVVPRSELRAAVANLTQRSRLRTPTPPVSGGPSSSGATPRSGRLCPSCAARSSSGRPPRRPAPWTPSASSRSCWRSGPPSGRRPAGSTPPGSVPTSSRRDGGASSSFRPIGPRELPTAPPTCSACWSSSTSTSGAGTSTPRRRAGGPIRGPNC